MHLYQRRHAGLPRRYVSFADGLRSKAFPPGESPPALSRRHSTASLHDHAASIPSIASRIESLKADDLPIVRIGNTGGHPLYKKLLHSSSEANLRRHSDDTFARVDDDDLNLDEQLHHNKSSLSPRAEAFFPSGQAGHLSDIHDNFIDPSLSPVDGAAHTFNEAYPLHHHPLYVSAVSPISSYSPHYMPISPVHHGQVCELGTYHPGATLSPPLQATHLHHLSDCSSNGSDHTIVGNSSGTGSGDIARLRFGEDNSRSLREKPTLTLSLPLIHAANVHSGHSSHAIPPRNALDLEKIERGEDTRTVG